MSVNADRREMLLSSCKLAWAPATAWWAGTASAQGSARNPAQASLTDLSAWAAVDAMKKGELKCETYVRALLEQAERASRLNVFRTLAREQLLESALMADKRRAAGAPLGLLHGLPVPVKDSINTASLPTSNGTASLRDWTPRQDAAVLTRLLAQGAMVMGKTNLHELSFGWTSNNAQFGAVRNPYDDTRVAGGSSGGSAAAVAARVAPLALGEDTLGSIRVPASMCGVVGFRPTLGRYPGEGVMPLTRQRLDQVGPMARTVADIALFDAAMTGQAAPVAATALNGLRVGVPANLLQGLDPAVERVVRTALAKLREGGLTLVELDLPESARAALDIATTMVNHEVMLAVSDFLAQQGAPVNFDQMLRASSRGLRGVIEFLALPPNRPSQASFEAALAGQARLITDLAQLMQAQALAALAFPPIMIPPMKLGDNGPFYVQGQSIQMYVAMARNVSLASTARMPSLVLPAGLTADALPVGLEFAAPSGADAQLLAIGLSLERQLGLAPAPRA